MRYFLECAYLGKNYVGWQRQLNGLSVQEMLEKALSIILQSEVLIHGSSRTDTGVHAASQFAHFDVTAGIADIPKLIFQLNSFLPFDISVNNIYLKDTDAHARFDAVGRSYIYRINVVKNPFTTETSNYLRQSLNLERLNRSCVILREHTDFQCFSKVKTAVKNFNCTVQTAEWTKTNDGYEFHISANRFLRGMVRAIVGTMIDVGTGKLSLTDFDKIIESKDRGNAGINVVAHGLTLERVLYPENYFITHD